MTHWVGIGMLIASIPLFFAARREAFSGATVGVRRVVHGGLFLAGLLGLFLALFGSLARTVAAGLLWIACAWALNR